jgi:hypothetical protein
VSLGATLHRRHGIEDGKTGLHGAPYGARSGLHDAAIGAATTRHALYRRHAHGTAARAATA